MDRIDLFRVFARVVECANFTRAADTLGMPRSSVSAAIQELEGRVGARLLHRTTRKVTPTQDGAALYERCLRLIADVEEAENLFRHSIVGPSGTLRVDMPGRIGRLIVAPALPEFLERYPQISVELGVTDRAVNLIEERVDCVLRVGTLSDSGLVARAIGDLPLINVASPAYLARHGVPRTPADLERHRPVNYASPSNGRVAPWEWVEGDEVKRVALRARVTVNSAEAYIACCLAGLGLI
ncbi:LysR family transcriptional regulator [Burkholderia mallei]|nr:bacterial regulatory helix-turn-helix, lysR family protein [Burkholderia mallei]SUW48008.1 LysR family transcriptional regulator [Burkholderia mallei]